MSASEVLEHPIRSDRVLIVDDRKDNLLALEAVLEPLRLELLKASSGPEALHYLLDGETAVIVLDVQMPGMDGFETAAILKSRLATRHIPIIFLTAISHDLDHQLQGYDAGAIDYICKPFDPDVLRAKVRALVEMSGDLRFIARTNAENREHLSMFDDYNEDNEQRPADNDLYRQTSRSGIGSLNAPLVAGEFVEMVRVLDMDVQVDPSALSAVRKAVAESLFGQPDEVVETAQLLANELATNSFVHACSPAAVRIDVGPSTVRLEVSDMSPSLPILGDFAPFETHGRGLYLVQQLTDRYGWTLTSGGKTVWLELDLPPRACS